VRKLLLWLFPLAVIAAALVAPVNNAYAEVTGDDIQSMRALIANNIALRQEVARLKFQRGMREHDGYCTLQFS
jgi:hypothetical protein